MLSREIWQTTEIVSGYVNCALPLDVSNHLGNRILGRNRDQHMDVIHPQMTLLDSALPLMRQLPNHLSRVASKFPVERFPPILRNPYKVILAFPDRVT